MLLCYGGRRAASAILSSRAAEAAMRASERQCAQSCSQRMLSARALRIVSNLCCVHCMRGGCTGRNSEQAKRRGGEPIFEPPTKG